MIIQFNTDKHIEGKESLESFVTMKVSSTLKHFNDHITRIEVHLSDENADKGGSDDIKCKIEARVKGMQPILVESNNASKEIAVNNAADKMKAALGTKLGKRNDRG